MEQFAEIPPSSAEAPVQTPIVESIPEPVAQVPDFPSNQQAASEINSVSTSPEPVAAPEVVVPQSSSGVELSDQALSDGVQSVRRSLTDPELEQLSQLLISRS